MTVAPPRSFVAATALEAVGLNGGIEGAGPNGYRLLCRAFTAHVAVNSRRASCAMAPGDHVLGRFRSGLSVAGVWEEDGELWSPGGELIAQSRQLALVRELPS